MNHEEIWIDSGVLHIEPSSRCTLACPQCPRTISVDDIKLEDCDIDSVVKLIKEKKHVIMCGNHGDPIYHPKFHELISSMRASNPQLSIGMHTNGAFRSTDWWKKTASILDQRDRIIFSIDGLPSNNHLYRVNSKWESIENGIRTLVEYNPDIKIIWKWILFKYNQNDINEGIILAKKLGFHGFRVVKSVRYEDEDPLTPTVDWKEIEKRYE
jgi:MoaA/NifB/PqqE/SkfB family radical SAM enzyme